jgi:hypothetical protein
MPNPQPSAVRARQLLILANACDDEDERTTYYALAEACLQELAACDPQSVLLDA